MTTMIGAPIQLSAHEHRIAVRAADGWSNQDIGDDFDVCSRTVEHHLTNVYRKLSIVGRNQLRAALRRYSANQHHGRRAGATGPPGRP
jgi:DNA-binding NarL/FixJ family response regulator